MSPKQIKGTIAQAEVRIKFPSCNVQALCSTHTSAGVLYNEPAVRSERAYVGDAGGRHRPSQLRGTRDAAAARSELCTRTAAPRPRPSASTVAPDLVGEGKGEAGRPRDLGISDPQGGGHGPPPRRVGPARHIAEEAVRSRDAGRRRPAVSPGPRQPLLLG